MQYKVPQHIDIEDKIVGPFTMKQFIYLLISGSIVYAWWNFSNTFVDPSPMVIFIPLALPVGFLGLAFALLKINDRPFEVFVLSLLRFIFSPKQRVWHEGYQTPAVIVKDPAAPEVKEEHKDIQTLDELAKSLDKTQGEIEKKKPAATTPAAPSQEVKNINSINLSVKDVETAAKQQSSAQTAATNKPNSGTNQPPSDITPAKKGFLGLFKG